MREKLGKRTDIAKTMIPADFPVGCRRPTVSTKRLLTVILGIY
jgi:hypothetical protein